MSLTRLTLRNLRRAPLRVAMTSAAVAMSLLAFIVLRTVSAGWTEQVAQTPKDRVVSRHKMGWDRRLPVHYVSALRELPEIDLEWGGSWGDLMLPANPTLALDALAVDPEPFLLMHTELDSPEAQKRAFLAERRGAFVSVELAKLLGWKLGDVVTFRRRSLQGEIQLIISGIYRSTRHGFARRGLYFHWLYHNESIPEAYRDGVNIMVSRVRDPSQAAAIAKTIDARFAEYDEQTFSQEDQATNAQLVGRFAAILDALDVLSVLILSVVMLVVANTVAMSVRERTSEYGTLRAIGFLPQHIAVFVLGEATALGLFGGLFGVTLSYVLVGSVVSRIVEQFMDFPPLHVTPQAAGVTLLLSGILGLLSAAFPCYRAMTLNVVDTLRRTG